ncbi:MAG: nicotinamide riboside transporter PnuC [Acinetobacter sp.]|nr:nicotinamide riboside transporter PnuC [Acinetobacter sp.]
MMSLLHWIFAQYQSYSTLLMSLELIAVITGLISVLLVKRGNILAYPIGLISTSLYVYLLWQWQLFGDMLINAYYTAMSLYGWLNWSKYSQNLHIPISRTTRQEYAVSAVLASVSFTFVTLIYYFKPLINNQFSWQGITLGWQHFTWMDYTDILTTGLFLVAMWLMARRKIEHWLLWIVADAISVPLYWAKGLIFTSLQYAIFTAVAISAYWAWRKLWQQQH